MLSLSENIPRGTIEYIFQFEVLPNEWYSFSLGIKKNEHNPHLGAIFDGLHYRIEEMIKMQWQKAIHDMEGNA